MSGNDLHLQREKTKLAIIEFGAGTAVPTVRIFSEDLAARHYEYATLIRVNPREAFVDSDMVLNPISIEDGALSSLKKIRAHLDELEAQKK